MANTNLEDRLVQNVSQAYSQARRQCQIIVEEEMGRHFDQIRRAVEALTATRAKMLTILTQFERDEAAERMLHDIVQGAVPHLHRLLSDFSPSEREEVVQQPLAILPADNPFLDDVPDSDARSFTMGLDAPNTPSAPSREDGGAVMGPPPVRSVAPVAPMTPSTGGREERVAEAGPSGLRKTLVHPNSHKKTTQNGKRPAEEPAEGSNNPKSPSKKPRKEFSASRLSPIGPPRSVFAWEAFKADYIFSDERCGSGWYVIRCNLSQQEGINEPFHFEEHPLENGVGLDHFNSKMPCHESDRKYTVEDIIREFSHEGE